MGPHPATGNKKFWWKKNEVWLWTQKPFPRVIYKKEERLKLDHAG